MLRRDWLDQIFSRLQVRYGHAFLSQYAQLDIEVIKADWAEELSGFDRDGKGAAIKYALDNLPEQAPNVGQFKAIAKRAPLPEFKALPAPKADPERVKAELAKFKPNGPSDPKDWARRILARVEAGEKPTHVSVTFAKQALGLIPGGF